MAACVVNTGRTEMQNTAGLIGCLTGYADRKINWINPEIVKAAAGQIRVEQSVFWIKRKFIA